ncbi:hypothetical protein BD779DRAFT_1508412 [Infundibulicybe gibba]|nr:hypothetical protein BD779DRAFT_1508412 [Infundibulicybe gibba]
MSLVRIPCILVATVGLHVAYTRPSKIPPPAEQVTPSIWERALLGTPVLVGGKVVFWSLAAIECSVIIANHMQKSPASQCILGVFMKNGDPQRLDAPPLVFLGAGLAGLGAFIRYRCYQVLGRFFTFERSIKRNHELVTTGPYSIVRHPSYAGTMLVYTGMALCHWYRGRGFVYGFTALIIATILPLLGRMSKEDEMMKVAFGDAWIRWARQVPYALIPGVY